MLPTIDVRGTTTIYSSYDEKRETEVQARVLSVAQSVRVDALMQDRRAETDNDKSMRMTMDLWEMVIVAIPECPAKEKDPASPDFGKVKKVPAPQKEGAFGLCVDAQWALETLTIGVMSDVMTQALEANRVTEPQRKNSSAQSDCPKQHGSSTAPTVESVGSKTSEGAEATDSSGTQM